eukprot:TRINITY_DN12208_c0_g1_i1.p1 TRINITY_DN12208_c0_g1~~TRINITY_DN12208_c0_g1_i1.p1  ORF type:complete len:314 (-),score=42.15 TRINITY_DN12208_c0_g1_i1:305-1246(-)
MRTSGIVSVALGVLVLVLIVANIQRHKLGKQPGHDPFTRQRKIVGFYHLGVMYSWKDVMQDQFDQLNSSGLLQETEMLYVGILSNISGIEKEVIDIVHHYDPQVKIQIEVNETFDLYEVLTLHALYDFCRSHSDYFAYYFHSKGTSSSSKSFKYKSGVYWRNEMQHFLFNSWRHIYDLLSSNIVEVVGVNYFCHPHHHFQGNFWWTACDLMQTHRPPRPKAVADKANLFRYNDEAWILDLYNQHAVRVAECFHDRTIRYLEIPNNTYWNHMMSLDCSDPTIIGLGDIEPYKICLEDYIPSIPCFTSECVPYPE